MVVSFFLGCMFFKLDAEVNHPRSLCCCGSYNYSVFLLKEAGRSTKRCLALRRVFGHVCDKNMYSWSVANIEASLILSSVLQSGCCKQWDWLGRGRSEGLLIFALAILSFTSSPTFDILMASRRPGVTRTQGFTNGPGPLGGSTFRKTLQRCNAALRCIDRCYSC